MSRKRSISSIIDDDEGESSSSRSFATSSHATSSRRHAVSNIINKETITNRPSSNRRLSICNCPKYNGRLVNSCTKEIYKIRYQSSQGEISVTIFQLEIQEETSDDHEQQEDSEFSVLPQRRVRKYKNHPKSITKPSDNNLELEADNTSESSESSEFTDEDIYSDVFQGRNESDDNEDSEIFEDYSPPSYNDEPDSPDLESTIDDRFLWILLWIMTFRIRFNITETATEALIKFMKLVLIEIGGDNFRDFLNLIYLAKKTLGLKDQFHSLVPCPKCHKLYQKQEVTNF